MCSAFFLFFVIAVEITHFLGSIYTLWRYRRVRAIIGLRAFVYIVRPAIHRLLCLGIGGCKVAERGLVKACLILRWVSNKIYSASKILLQGSLLAHRAWYSLKVFYVRERVRLSVKVWSWAIKTGGRDISVARSSLWD